MHRPPSEGVDRGPLISCVVPVFNCQRFLAQALDSIFAQTYRPIETIVVNDGCEDGSADIIAGYGDRIKTLKQDNAGPAAARNRGVDLAKGEFLAFLDADDLWHKEKLTRQMSRFSARPELELCLTLKEHFWEPGRKHEEALLKEQRHVFVEKHPGFVTQTLLVRRSAFDHVGRFDETLRISEDTDWFARAQDLALAAEVFPEVLVYRRMHSANLTLSATREDRLAVVTRKLQRQRMKAAPDGAELEQHI